MLRIEEGRAGYGLTPILESLSLRIEQGERVAILGRNGVGKTTLLRALIGELPLMSGRVWLRDEEITKLPPYERARRGIATSRKAATSSPGSVSWTTSGSRRTA